MPQQEGLFEVPICVARHTDGGRELLQEQFEKNVTVANEPRVEMDDHWPPLFRLLVQVGLYQRKG